MAEELELLCPIRRLTVMEASGAIGDAPESPLCWRERCEWWHKYQGCCAVWLIARNLEELVVKS